MKLLRIETHSTKPDLQSLGTRTKSLHFNKRTIECFVMKAWNVGQMEKLKKMYGLLYLT